MAELLQKYSTTVVGRDGTEYVVRSYGEERSDGTWAGWLEFDPSGPTGQVFRTGQDTSQPNRLTIEYWATGLEPVYFEGALERALNNNEKSRSSNAI